MFARYLNGENITPQLDWLVARGFNVLRIFGEVPAGFRADQYGIANFERPFERPDFDTRLHAFFDVLASRGLRCEYTVLTYTDASDVMRAHLQRVFDVAAASHWNVFIEVANEPENNRIDPVTVMQGVNRRGVLSAYGLDPGRHDVAKWKTDAVLDYGVAHDLNAISNTARSSESSKEMQNAFGVPFVNDEPIGAIDPGHKLFKQTGPETRGGVNGGGARTVNRDLFISAAAIAYCRPATRITSGGVEGRVPSADMKVQDGVAAALLDVARFIPDDAPLGTFVEPALANGGVGVILRNEQWVVVPMPPAGWMPVLRDGWRIGGAGPVPYMLRLIK